VAARPLPITAPSVLAANGTNVAFPHVPVLSAPVRSTLRKSAPPLVPKSVPELPPTRDLPSPGSGNPFPGSLAVLLAAAAAASLVATRLRSATTVWPSLLFASLIERPG
jgi:hypothetical protein